MRNWSTILIIIVTLFIFTFLPIIFYTTLVGAESLETSIVLLTVSTEDQVIKSDPFFEILDMGEYILIPLNLLSSYLDLNVTYLRQENSILVGYSDKNIEVKVDIDNGIYIDHNDWANQPPVTHNGDFYVSPLLVEYITGATIEWNSQYQELNISGNFEKQKEISKESKEDKNKGIETEGETIDPITGPDFSLGSIQYKLVWEKREEIDGQSSSTVRQNIYFHGRAEDWAVSMGQETDLDLLKNKQNTKLKYIRGKYNKNNKLIIIGDALINFNNTIGKKDLRGVLYRFPEQHINKLFAYTSISGDASNGDKVILYLNGKKYDDILVENGSYNFVNVPLRVKRLNIIKVVINKKMGEKIEIVKKVAASPRILPIKTREFSTAAGLYKDTDKEKWEGQMISINMNRSLSEKSSLNLNTIARKDFENKTGSIIYGSDFGLAFRVSENTVVAIDWLVGGEEDNIQQGSESTLLYCFEKGYTEAVLFNVAPEVDKGLNIITGRGFKIKGFWDLSKIWSMQVKGLWKEEESKLKEIELTFFRTKNIFNRSYILTRVQDEEIGIKEFKTEKALKMGIERRRDGFKGSGDLLLSSANIYNKKSGKNNFKTLGLETDLFKAFSKKIYATLDVESSQVWLNNTFWNGEIFTSSTLKWNVKKDTDLTIIGEVMAGTNPEKEFIYEEDEINLSVMARHYLNDNTDIFFSLSGVKRKGEFKYYYYNTFNSGINYYYNNYEGKLSLNVEYVSPVGERKEPQWSTGIYYRKNFESGLGLDVKLQKLYDTIWDKESEYVFTIGVDSALGFADGMIQGQKYKEGEHISYVGGIVYLDENGNGILDEGEDRLPGIKMSLNGRRVETDKSGIFRFDYVRPDVYRLGFALERLPADYTPITEEKIIRVRENENLFFNFGLTMNGTISGRVFIDKNANGEFDERDEPVQWVGIILDKDKKKAYTNSSGKFYLENIPLGKHLLTIQAGSLPDYVIPANDSLLEISITKDSLDARNIQIPLVYKFVE